MITRGLGTFLAVVITWAVMTSGIFGGVGPIHNIQVTVTEPLTAVCSLTEVTLVPGQAVSITCTVENPSTQDVTVRLQTTTVPPSEIMLLSPIDLYLLDLLAGATLTTEYRLFVGPNELAAIYQVAVNVVILDAPTS